MSTIDYKALAGEGTEMSELQYALDRMSTPLHASRISDATAAEDARCMAIIRAEIDRLTRERDEARAERDTLLEVAQAIEGALRFASAAEVLDENSPIRDGLRAALAQIEQERSEQGKEG